MGLRDASGGPRIRGPVRPAPSRLTPFRDDVERIDVDVDELFAPEPDEAPEPRLPESPTLIFTQPADRNVQQFADESAQFADEISAPPPHPPHNETLLLHVAPPYHGVWNEPNPPARRRSSFGVAALGLLGAAAMAAFLFVNGGSPAEPAAGNVEPTTANAADAPATPMPSTDPAPSPAATEVRQQPSNAPVADTAATRSLLRRRESPNTSPLPPANRDAARATATTGRAARTGPSVSTREVTDAPGVTAPPPVPAPDVARPGAVTAEPVGQPLTPAPDVASLAPPRSAGPAVRDPAPSDTPAPVAPAPPAAGLDPRSAERDRVRAVLAGYERAYNTLDADAASRVFPGVDRRALSRAFSGLSAQEVRLEDCRIAVLTSTATATYAGSLRWTPKVGGGNKEQPRNWQFNLQQMPGGWRISSVRVQ